jgi:hypothetical protein
MSWYRWLIITACVVCLSQGLVVVPAGAQTLGVGGATAGTPALKNGPYTVSLTKPITALAAPTAPELTLMGTTFGAPKANWTFAAAPALPGSFDVLQYSNFALSTRGGANITVEYISGAEKAPDLCWINIDTSSNWGKGRRANGVFSDSASPYYPFYGLITPENLPDLKTFPGRYVGDGSIWDDDTDYPEQNLQNPEGGGKVPAGDLLFLDEPSVPYSYATLNKPASINFDTYLVSFTYNGMTGTNAGGTVTIYGGFSWGVQITNTPEPSVWIPFPLAAALLWAYARSRRLRRQHRLQG